MERKVVYWWIQTYGNYIFHIKYRFPSWDLHSCSLFELYASDRTPIVTCNRNASLFKSNPPTLSVAPEAVMYLDKIIIGYIVSLRDHKMLSEEY
jgi:hypothetical protein